MEMLKWIDLKDKQSGAKLKLDTVNGGQVLFIIGLSQSSPKWKQSVDELKFRPSSNNKYLLRILKPGERIKASMFSNIWPDVVYSSMEVSKVGLNLSGNNEKHKARTDEEREIANELANARRIGRNYEGDEVYEGSAGRFISTTKGIIPEIKSLKPSMFLRSADEQSLNECADGFVYSLKMNEVLRADDINRFTQAITEKKPEEIKSDDIENSHEIIDAAIIRALIRDYDTPNDAYGDSVRLYEYMPAYHGGKRGEAAMPIPLSVMAQRLLGDTAGKTITYPNAFDGAAFSFLSDKTTILAYGGQKDISSRAKSISKENVHWATEFHPARDVNSDGMFFNADSHLLSDGTRSDYREALLAIRSLAKDARAVLVLAGDDPLHPGIVSPASSHFYTTLYSRYQVEDVFEVARELTKVVGDEKTLRVISLKNREPSFNENGVLPLAPKTFTTCHSWDEAKAFIDESLARASIREAQSDGIDLKKSADDNSLQRPYIAFSTVGEATTMVPKELQQPLQAFMSDLESVHGPVDSFVERELGFAGDNTLAKRFSPEQIDSLAMMIHRMKRGRGHILGDETGIGKGRSLAGLATWALKQDKPVVFITDRANLFSDLTRDLRDIGEWGRVRPFVMNSDGKIVDNIGDSGVLAEGIKSGEMKRVLDSNLTLAQTGCNFIFTTYSQISGVDSEKAVWLKNQLKDALLIVDEAHVTAGSDSNISTQVAEMTSMAWGVQYSSATWAKSAANLHIFARAFPESVNVGTLAKTMRRGGEAFSEIFSSMLAREGALIRREHDLSKLEFVVEVDTVNAERNNQVADRVAEIMSSLAFTAGALKRIVTRMSDLNVSVLRDARDVRVNAQSAKVFKSRFGTGSMLYQVNRRINAALNVENAVRLAIEGIEAGRKPVIVFEDTGESFIKQALEAQAITLPDGTRTLPTLLAPPTIKDLLRRIIDTLTTVRVEDVQIEDLPTLDTQDITDADRDNEIEENSLANQIPGIAEQNPVNAGENAQTTEDGITVDEMVRALTAASRNRQTETDKKPVKEKKKKYKLVPFWEIEHLSDGDKKTFDEGISEINRLIETLPDIALNAPDEITRRLTSTLTKNGDYIRVGELSGRSFMLHPQANQEDNTDNDINKTNEKLCKLVPRKKSKELVNETVRGFNSGSLDVLLINRSAATGISLHASPRFLDRRRRQLIEMQIPENPTDRIQLYGRVNRFDQESFPLIQVASTGIYGEVRQIMVQNKKLSEMSANVRSSRDSHALIRDVPDLLNPLGKEVCRQFLEDNPEIISRLDMSPADLLPDSQRDLATCITSRVPLLRIDEQKQVYEQLYSMFEDAIVQAELMGNNPLKPNELDVHAKVGEPKLLFGFDHKGIGSAFDGGVFAQRIDWVEDVRPLALEAILEIVKINRQKLIDSGRVKSAGLTPCGTQILDMSDLTKRTSLQLEGRARIAIVGTEFKNTDEALRSMKPNPIRRGFARAKWIADNLPKLVPGRVISMPRSDAEVGGFFMRRNAVILDIVAPADRRESQLAQWRVLTIAPGEKAPISTTLNALIGRMTSVEDTSSNSRPTTAINFEALSRLEIGGDLIEMSEVSDKNRKEMKTSWIYRDFEQRYVGQRDRKALVLTGNMYLASEWAVQTKAGSGVIFTDDRGLRHRAIILKDTFKPEWLKYLPARLWTPGMIDRFVDKLNNGEIEMSSDRHVLYSSFDGAWKSTEASNKNSVKDVIWVIPGQGLMMHVGKEARRRINVMLRQAQKTIKEETFPDVKIRSADDPGHVMIKEASATRRRGTYGDDSAEATRGDGEYISMRAETPEKMHRAFQMLMRGPGLEIFIPPTNERQPNSLSNQAKNCMRDYYIERLREDARDDPARIAKLEEILRIETGDVSDIRANEIEAELNSIRMFGEMDDDSQYSIDFLTGEHIPKEKTEEVREVCN